MTTEPEYPTTTGTDLDAPPDLDRPAYHVWIGEGPEDEAPTYVGLVTVTNADQLTAETQSRALGLHDMKAQPLHFTALWIWAACVRRGITTSKFRPFCQVMDYRPVDKPKADPEGPTDGAQGPSTDSA